MEEVDFSKKRREIDTDLIKCNSCGGTMVFNPEKQTLVCDHCGNTIDIEKNFNVYEHDIEEGFKNAKNWDVDEQVTYSCENCGAIVVMTADTQATMCPFCGTTHIVQNHELAGLKPQYVIPFSITADKGAFSAKKWVKKKLFAPRKFKKSFTVQNIHGVYEPCFTFDSHTTSTYHGRVGDRHERVVGSGKNRRTEVYYTYRNVSGTYSHFFDDVMVATNKNFDQKRMNSLAPYDLGSACQYENKFLSGYVADRYRKGLKPSWEDARKMMENDIRSEIIRQQHCDRVEYMNVKTMHKNVTFKYLLIPVYMLTYTYKKKVYNIYINGTTAKVKGPTPVSPLRVIIAIILGLAALFGITCLLIWMKAMGYLESSVETVKQLGKIIKP